MADQAANNTAELADLRARHSALEKKNAQLEQEHSAAAEFVAEHEALLKQHKALEKEHEALRTSHTALEERHAAVAAELGELRGKQHVAAPQLIRPEPPVKTPTSAYYEVIVDTWGYDSATHSAHSRGAIIAAADVGPHWEWAVNTGTIKPLTAKEARAQMRSSTEEGGDNEILPEDDAITAETKTQAAMAEHAPSPDDDPETVVAKAASRTRIDVQRTRAAEARYNRAQA